MSKLDTNIMDEDAGRQRRVLALQSQIKKQEEIIRIEEANAALYERLAAVKPSIDNDPTDEKHYEKRGEVFEKARTRRAAMAERIAQENAALSERLAAVQPSIDNVTASQLQQPWNRV